MWHERRAQRVLVAEDDPAIRELVVTRLDLAGYRTCEARDGQVALERWKAFAPQLVILDVNMPGLDGFGVLQAAIRRDGGLRVPVMMLTARRSRADVDRARALGARDYMVKPFDAPTLIRRVEKLLRPPAFPAAAIGAEPASDPAYI